MAKRILTLSIEGTTVRILSASGDKVEAWHSALFNPRFIRGGFVADAPGLGEVIKNALEEKKFGKGTVVCAFPAVGTTSRILTLPKVERGQLATIVNREARRLVGAALDESYLHWRALPSTTAQQQVYLLTVPKEPLNALIKAAEAAGLKPSIVDLKPIALMRAVNRRDAIIGNGESNSMEAVIVIDDLPVMTRSAFLGEEMLSQDYAVGRMSDELVRTIAAYNDSHQEQPLDPELPVYLTGAVASSVAFAINVATLTGRPIEPLEPPLNYPSEFPVAHYMVNMGLVIRAL